MAGAPRLKIAIADYGHTKALKSGAVTIKGIEPDFVQVTPIIGAFRRMVRDVEFDVCEMAPTTYMIARALGAPFIALPIVVMRRFHHSGFVVRPDSGIKVPKDLEGKKVGVRAYSVTTGVWTRGIFVNEYGLDSSKVTWVVDDEEHVTQLKLPPNVVHAPEGKSLAGMMDAGELHAAFTGNAGIGRAGSPTGGWQAQTTAPSYPELIPNAAQVEADWFKRTGIYPIHGMITVRTEVLWKHPFVARALYDAFVEAKKPYIAQLKSGAGDSADDKKYRDLMPLVGDPLPYGMKPNLTSIEAMLTYGLQQNLIPKRMSLEEAFVDPEKV
jgi:4,5-dihydroxyphthalate decarboxylase